MAHSLPRRSRTSQPHAFVHLASPPNKPTPVPTLCALWQVTCELVHPMAVEEGMRFAFREGGKTVGAGVVTKLYE